MSTVHCAICFVCSSCLYIFFFVFPSSSFSQALCEKISFFFAFFSFVQAKFFLSYKTNKPIASMCYWLISKRSQKHTNVANKKQCVSVSVGMWVWVCIASSSNFCFVSALFFFFYWLFSQLCCCHHYCYLLINFYSIHENHQLVAWYWSFLPVLLLLLLLASVIVWCCCCFSWLWSSSSSSNYDRGWKCAAIQGIKWHTHTHNKALFVSEFGLE